MKTSNVKLIIVISGKRKSGKDYVADEFVRNFGADKCIIIRLASPIKSHFAKTYGLDFEKMLTASAYKEQMRQEMILWGEEKRNMNPYIFCETIMNDAVESNKQVWIVSDARRITDVEYFKNFCLEENLCVKSIRVNSDITIREHRGWKFTKGVDDTQSECGLDSYKDWSIILENSMDDDLKPRIKEICKDIVVNIKCLE